MCPHPSLSGRHPRHRNTRKDPSDMDVPRKKLIDGIAKSLAVTVDRGATEAEANTAAAMAKQLMDSYGISDKDLSQSEADDGVVVLTVDTTTRKWRRLLAVSVADAFCCKSISCSYPARVEVIGFEADAHVASALIKRLSNRSLPAAAVLIALLDMSSVKGQR